MSVLSILLMCVIEAFTCLECNNHFKASYVRQDAIKAPSAQLELPLFGGKP